MPESERAVVLASRNVAATARWLDARSAAYVSHLLNDHVATLRRHYVAWPPWMAARLREPLVPLDWAHPRAYDVWMDRLSCSAAPVDWGAELDLPLPPGLSHADLHAPVTGTAAHHGSHPPADDAHDDLSTID